MKKRWLGILLTIGMVLTLLPTAAWAEGETGTKNVSTAEELTAALADSTADVVKLTADITLSESLTVSRTVTLDLNDHVLTLALTGEDPFFAVSGKNTNMTLTDSAKTKTERKFSTNQDGAWVLDENGDQTVTGGVITGGKTHVDEYGFHVVDSGVLIEKGSTLNVTDVTLNAPVKIDSYGTITGSGIFNSTVINEDQITGGTFYGPVANHKGGDQRENRISGGIFYGTVANGLNYNDSGYGEMASPNGSGLISGGTFYGKVTNAFSGKITGGSFYGEVDNRERTDSEYQYRGTLAGGTFYAGNPGTVAEGCCTVTYTYPTYDKTYAIQIVQKGDRAIRPTEPERSDFTFGKWYTYDDTVYDFATAVTDDMTLYGLSTDTSYGIRITDKGGNVVYVTSKNANDVLGDDTVSYTPGYWNEAEIPSEYWNDSHTALTWEAQEKLLGGEEIPGIRLPKLTLNGADIREFEADAPRNITIDDWLLVELKGENRVSYSGTQSAIDWNEQGVLVTGDGSLTVDAPNAQTAIQYADGGAYVQRGGTVTLIAKDCGFSYSEPMFCRFLGGRLTIQAGNEADKNSGALHCLDGLFTAGNIPDSATFLLGDSAENYIQLAPPYTQENVSRQWEAAKKAETITRNPWYLSLTSNHTVTFDSAGGSEVESLTVPYGGTISPTSPTKSGYTFAGWYLGDTKYDFSTPVTANLELTVHWTRNSSGGGGGGTTTYTLTFDTNGGSALSALRLARGSTVDLARYVPERSGHVFTGWYADAALTQPIETVTLSASTTVYAGWRAETNDLPFTDVDADAWYRDDVQYVYDAGLMTGTTADRFAPNGSMTRAMLVTVLWRQAGSPVVNYAMDFSDVAEGAWYAEAVRWAAAEGVVGGYGDGRFGPDDPITREQLATILFRHLVGDGAAELADWLRPYADADQIGAYAVPAMQWAVGHGVLKGDGDQLAPQGTATRAQVAAVLHRALEL